MRIERTFGLLKIRFRILLDCLPLLNIKKVPETVLACCVLHNICMLQHDEFPIVVCPNVENAVPNVIENATQLGNIKRNRVMRELRMQLQE